jgi:hypothetical protein
VYARFKARIWVRWAALTRERESSCGMGSQGRWEEVTRRAGLRELEERVVRRGR